MGQMCTWDVAAAAAAVAGNAAAAEAAAVADVGSGHSANRSSSIIFN